MKLALAGIFLVVSSVAGEFCHSEVSTHCSAAGDELDRLQPCTSRYSGVHNVQGTLEELVRKHLSHSFQYLLMSTNFGNYVKNRDGLSKLFRKLSDRTWEDAIDTIKYMAKRGLNMPFGELTSPEPNPDFKNFFEMHELESLSRALDMSKDLANKVHHIHGEVTKKHPDHHDADTSNFLEEKFVEKHTETIRDLSGHTNDLMNLIKSSTDPSLAIFLFDEHLKSIY